MAQPLLKADGKNIVSAVMHLRAEPLAAGEDQPVPG
jgi:hypothetical protein